MKTATISDEPDIYQELVKRWEKKGEQKGKLKGEALIVLRLLNRRCGTLSPDLENQVRSLSESQLESLGDALLDFQSITDLLDFLQQ